MNGDPIAAWRRGEISSELAVARLLLAGQGERAAEEEALHALLAGRPERIAGMVAMLAGVRHDAASSVEAVAAMFDDAVRAAPEASVAAYTLNDPEILARATDELVAWLFDAGLIGRDRDVLDLGCGIGRVTARLVPLCRSVTGIDVSAGMVEEARRRHGALTFALCNGRDLANLFDRAFDLVLAVDVFPYLVQADVARAHVGDAARILRRGGALAVLNLSYQGKEADRAHAAAWAGDYGFTLETAGSSPFSLWDGSAFVFRRPV